MPDRALYLEGIHLRYLYLQRIQFMDLNVLRALLPSLGRLEVLGVYQCQLIEFKHTSSLLEIVDDVQRNGKRQIKLDFFPRYHAGRRVDPAELDNLQDSWRGQGEFGLSARDLGLDARRAVASLLVYQILPRVLQSGQTHWLKPNSSFRQFLERLPLPDYFVIRVLAAFMWKINIGRQGRAMTAEEHVRYEVSLCRGVFGDTGLTRPRDKMLIRLAGLWSRRRECDGCRHRVQDYFYYEPLNDTCDGCKLKYEQWSAADHYKGEKRGVIGKLMGEPVTRNLAVALIMRSPGMAWSFRIHPDIREAKRIARLLDDTRELVISRTGVDKERQAVQPPHPYATGPNYAVTNKYFEQQTWDHMLGKRNRQDRTARAAGRRDGYIMPPIGRAIVSPRQVRTYPKVSYDGEDIAWEDHIMVINFRNDRSVETLPLECVDPVFPRFYG